MPWAFALTARVIGARDDAEFAVLCPHTMNAHFDGLACDDYFLRSTLEMMRRCDAVLMVPGWRASKGAMAERDEAIKLGIPVFEDLGDLIEWGEGTTA